MKCNKANVQAFILKKKKVSIHTFQEILVTVKVVKYVKAKFIKIGVRGIFNPNSIYKK